MGLNFFLSRSTFDGVRQSKQQEITITGNPNPNNYTILKSYEHNGFTLLKIKYHDCVNYEGNKILLFKCSLANLHIQNVIDPHFSDNKKLISPIARFEPTDFGWRMGLEIIEALSTEKKNLNIETILKQSRIIKKQ